MTNEQINAAIATECGWKVDKRGLGWLSPKGCYTEPPDYCTDLNAVHDAEQTLSPKEFVTYIEEVMELYYEPMRANARQRAEAFLRTLGKWEEAK
jgi:hypothetical protein